MKKTLKKTLCGVCSAAMLLGAVSISASAASGFTDVKDSDYFAKPVEWAVQNGVTAGVGDGKFGPNQSCTRAQAMTFLWRAAGSPEPTSSASFSDVSSSDYYAKPVAWAVENGITAGVGGGEFGADDTCTRGQIMTFLWRFGGSEEVQGSESFSDVSSSDYFAKPVAWAVANNVTAGIGGGKFGPNQSCTRGQIMTMLWRADQIDAPVVPDPEPTDPTVPETTEPTVPEYVPPVTTPDDKEFPYVDEYEEYKREVAKWTAYYINEYRKEEGVQTAEWLPGLTLVAEYRADQTTIIFDHNTDDIREANNYYQYGEYVDMTEFTKPEDSYYSYGDAEALVRGGFTPDSPAQEEGRIIANTLRNSAGHWSYIGNHEPGTNYAYIGVGVEVDSKGRECVCVCVSEKNYDIGWVNPHA